MTYDSQKHHRRSIRLKGYDYSQAGAYFVTICVQDRACLFGEVVGDQMHLNDAGRIVLAEWEALPGRFSTVKLDVFGVMPNHLHGIIVIGTAGAGARPGATTGATTRVAPTSAAVTRPFERAPVGAGLVPAPIVPAPAIPAQQPTLGDIVGSFKSLTTDLYIYGVKQLGWPGFRGRLWQRNYHEHIIRTDTSLNCIRQYIRDNPAQWALDPENPQAETPKTMRQPPARRR